MYKILLLILLPTSSFAQKKGDSKIVVLDTSLNKVAKILYQNGYSLEQRDNEIGFLASTEKNIDNISSLKIRVLKSDSTIVLTGLLGLNIKLGNEERTFDALSFGGMKKSARRNCWDELDKIAKQVGAIIRYE